MKHTHIYILISIVRSPFFEIGTGLWEIIQRYIYDAFNNQQHELTLRKTESHMMMFVSGQQ